MSRMQVVQRKAERLKIENEASGVYSVHDGSLIFKK